MRRPERPAGGFTLLEVLVALALTALVATAAYAGLSAALDGIEATRDASRRIEAVNRSLALVARDLRQTVDRPVRDLFGQSEPALTGGPLARYPLTLTRAGWHNTAGLPRSTLERVSYVVEDGALWRVSLPVLDAASATTERRLRLLEAVESLELRFLASDSDLGSAGPVDTRRWQASWIADPARPGDALPLPAALELRLTLTDFGLLRRLHVLPLP